MHLNIGLNGIKSFGGLIRLFTYHQLRCAYSML